MKVGDYARVIATNHQKNEIKVRFDNGRTLTYNPKRLSGVSVYYEAERTFAEGDRIQIRAPNRAKRIANGELGTITKIEPKHIRLVLDSGREIRIDPQQFPHLDHGYAVTSHSSQGLTFDRVLVNIDTTQSAQLVNDRTAYVAISRARDEALIYTDSAQDLRDSLNRSTNKESALEATRESLFELKKDRPDLARDPLAPQQQPPTEHSVNKAPTHAERAQAKAAERRLEFDLVNRDLAKTIEIELVERVPHEMIELELVERDLYEKTIELEREAAQTTSIEKGKTQEADTKEIEDLNLDDLLH